MFGLFVYLWNFSWIAFSALRISKSLEETIPFSISVSLENIPKQIISTSPNGHLLPKFPCYDQTWKSVEYDDQMMDAFLQSTFPNLSLNESFKFMVEKADLFRYEVINKYGGMYVDSDTECRHPVQDWMEIMGLDQIEAGSPSGYILENVLHRSTAPSSELFGSAIGQHTVKVDMVIGIEFYDTRRPLAHFAPDTRCQFVQWAFLSSPNNPILSAVIDRVVQNVETIPDERARIIARTGPGVWTKAIVSFIEKYSLYEKNVPLLDYRQIDAAGQLIPMKYNGEVMWVLVLPYRSFGYHRLHELPPPIIHLKEGAFIYHEFKGSWRG